MGDPQTDASWRPCSAADKVDTSWVLTGLYCALATASLIQRIRLELLNGGSMQKLFHLLLLANCTVRAVFFGLLAFYGDEHYPGGSPLNSFLNILPDSLFFTTFCLLVMFWANIFHKARNRPPEFLKRVRRALKTINVVVYLTQLIFWLCLNFVARDEELDTVYLLFHIQVVLLCLLTTCGFILYGGSLYFLLRGFPIHSSGQRQRLLREVGWVTSICCATFTVRALMVLLFIARPTPDITFWVCGCYFIIVEVIPSALVLWILRHMPPVAEKLTLFERIRFAVRDKVAGSDRGGRSFKSVGSSGPLDRPFFPEQVPTNANSGSMSGVTAVAPAPPASAYQPLEDQRDIA